MYGCLLRIPKNCDVQTEKSSIYQSSTMWGITRQFKKTKRVMTKGQTVKHWWGIENDSINHPKKDSKDPSL